MFRTLTLSLLLVATVPGCKHALQPMEVGLRWKPTDDTAKTQSDIAHALGGRKVWVKDFVDARDDKRLIGVNVQRPASPVNVTTGDDAGRWCSEQLRQMLKGSGVELAESGAELVLSGKLTQMIVTEGETYDGRVTVSLELATPKRRDVWTGTAAGQAKRWGRDFAEDNYMEAISDAYSRALEDVFAKPDFIRAARQR